MEARRWKFKKNLPILILIFLLSGFKSQEIESICLYKKQAKFENKFKNYTERDSLVLYKDSTFKKFYNYWGFVEFSRKYYSGNWVKDKNSLKLLVKKREDSLKSTNFKSFEIIYSLKKKKLISPNPDFKNLKKVKF